VWRLLAFLLIVIAVWDKNRSWKHGAIAPNKLDFTVILLLFRFQKIFCRS
jgi:hypothetical protein